MFNLTKEERKVLIFLGALALLGLSVLWYKNYFARPRLKVVRAELSKSGLDYEAILRRKRTVNINTADQKTLELLPNVGPALARDIIEYRNTYGVFVVKEDIVKVKGIGPKKYEAIKDYISVE